MGILDFREICSGNPSHDSVKKAPSGVSNLPDDFELFCQEFFTQVKRFRIFRSVSNGPDLGIDLGVEEHTNNGIIKWLVSCKHYSHSGGYISDEVERGIVERVDSWECDGFIPFYTGIPTSTLSQHILGAEKRIKVERYYKDRIEQEMLKNSNGCLLAARYFPKSMTNHYHSFIKPSDQFKKSDIKIDGNVAKLEGMHAYLENPRELSHITLERLVKDANIIAGLEQHKPYFKKAVNDATSAFPEMFTQTNTRHQPTWHLESLLKLAEKNGLSKAYFVCAAWSFWDFRKANNLFADFMIIRSKEELREPKEFDKYKKSQQYEDHHYTILKRGLLTPGLLGIKLQDAERDIIARMFAYTNPI